MRIKALLARMYWVLSVQFGIDPRRMLRSLLALTRYGRDLVRFRSSFTGRLELLPCLYDWSDEGGTTKSEYFWQDLLVARMICARRPAKHVDIGSRVDGFVAHVASFREIEVLDIRPITTKVPGVTFRQADLMDVNDAMSGCCDSLSCLHALEHFGLGRYGDPVDPAGFERGLANIARLLEVRGILYLSVPVGIARVEFNAHRISDPRVVIGLAEKCSLELSMLTVIRPGSGGEQLIPGELELASLAQERYALAIFEFRKASASHVAEA
jgi:hypothetical protein